MAKGVCTIREGAKKIARYTAYGFFACLAIVGLAIGISRGFDEYEKWQLLNGNADYHIAKRIDAHSGKSYEVVECNFSPYPLGLTDQELEEAIIKTVLKIRKENPSVDIIEIKGGSDGFLDFEKCSAYYRRERPQELFFQNYGWTKMKESKYEKILMLPAE